MRQFIAGLTVMQRVLGVAVGIAIAIVSMKPPTSFAAVVASQTMSLYRYGDKDETLVSYTAIGRTGAQWRVRGAVSWWRWKPDSSTGQVPEAGVGALDLTLGRSLWTSFGQQAASRGWVQIKSTVPLTSTPSPVSSGEFDWGFSFLTTNRFRDFLFFAELGYLSPGDPIGVTYDSRFSAAVSASWHRPWLPVYPVASYAAGSSIIEGIPGFGEWSAGLGVRLGRRAGVLVLYTQGTTATSPDKGFTMIVNLRL